MGKTRPTTRQLINEWNQKWEHYRRAIRDVEGKKALDDVRGHVREHAMPAKAHNPPRIEDEVVWLNIAVSQQRQINELQSEIYELREQLE